MSMSMHIVGLISSDNKLYKKHKAVLLACIDAGIKELPKETAIYFGNKIPYDGLLEEKLMVDIPYDDYMEDMKQGYEIDVDKIPEGVKKIRFYNSY